MCKVTVAFAQRSRWQVFALESSKRDDLAMFELRRIAMGRSNSNVAFGRQSFLGRGDSSNAAVINNPTSMAGVVERNPAMCESPD